VDLTIAHISDMHAGSPRFVPELMERAIDEINAAEPDLLIGTGDFTTAGYLREYEVALGYLERIRCGRSLYVPGNHDSRNVGYRIFEDLMGSRFGVLRSGGVTVLGLDSSEPDIDGGIVGREWYGWIKENLASDARLRICALHHHLLPVPGTGRDPSVAYDAGDVLEVLVASGADLVLTGHKHVPWVWRLEGLYVSTAGTVSTTQLRGLTQPCYSLIRVTGDRVRIDRCTPGGDAFTVADWCLSSRAEHSRQMDAVLEAVEPVRR